VKTLALQLAFLLLSASGAFCQGTKLSDSCDLSIFGDKDTKIYLEFDKELRVAIAKQDPVAMAFLVHFPLRVNSDGGKTSLDDPEALQAHFQEVFPEKVRKAIMDQNPAQIMCRDQGIMYGNGEVWVNVARFGFAIEVINLEAPPLAKPSNHRTEFVCQTDKYRIVVDSDASRVPRYRAWSKPRPITDNPDVEISKGDSSFEGTGLCAYPVWTFKSGKAVYQVEGALGCFGDSEPGPPKDAKGRLEIQSADQSKATGWCF
jgi:hypothetical protein